MTMENATGSKAHMAWLPTVAGLCAGPHFAGPRPRALGTVSICLNDTRGFHRWANSCMVHKRKSHSKMDDLVVN